MKHGNTYYLQLTRRLFNDDKLKELSQNAKWLFVVLKELELRYTGPKENFFIRSDIELTTDTGMSLATLKRAKSELIKTDLIQTWKAHWLNKETKKKSEKHITAYRILV